MRICFIGPANSAHIVKWCNWFSSHGHDVHVISFTIGEIENSTVHLVDNSVDPGGTDLQKLKYLFTGNRIKKIVDSISPDIVNVHYATSYGIAVALSGIKEYILSIWGSDIYDFPQRSLLHRLLLSYSLKRASLVFSTSYAMAQEAHKYTKKPITVTPFGVDLSLFNPDKGVLKTGPEFVVGTVKALSDKYGIADILNAVAEVKNGFGIPIKLRIAGNGPQKDEYFQLAKDLNIDKITTWLGFISQSEAAKEWANMDVAIIPSTLESFGVSAVEAQACETAVIVSNIPGLMEATKPGVSSLVVSRNNPHEIAMCLLDLYNHPDKRIKLAMCGRKYVEDNYELNHCFQYIESCYLNFLDRN